MWSITYKDLKGMYTSEVLQLCSINNRFDNEEEQVQEMRIAYVVIFQRLTQLRDDIWRSEAGRNYAIAITELENSCIRA